MSAEPGSGPRSRAVSLAVVSVVTLAVVAALAAVVANRTPPPLEPPGRVCLEGRPPVDIDVGAVLRSEWRALDATDCRAGSWLATYREGGTNLQGYKAEAPPRGAEDGFLLVHRLGEAEATRADEALLAAVVEFVGLYFQTPVERGPRRPLPAAAFHPERGLSGQYDAAALLDLLRAERPAGAVASLAWTDRDLFVPGLEYVFGLGHFRHRVGVASSHRVRVDVYDPRTRTDRPVRAPEPLRRAIKVAVHELAHEFGIGHCVHFRHCVMAGTAGMREADAKRLALCPLDHAKLQWNLGFDPAARLRDLSAWADAHGLHPEAAYWRRAAGDFPGHPAASGGPPTPRLVVDPTAPVGE